MGIHARERDYDAMVVRRGVSEPEGPPTGASGLGKSLFPGAGSLRWVRLGSGGISRVWRLSASGGADSTSVVIKETGALASDPDFGHREAMAYQEVLPRLSIRVPRLLGSMESGDVRYLALEDLVEYRFPAQQHLWSVDEFKCFLPSYAQLHVEGIACGRKPWMLEYGQPTWSPDSVSFEAVELARLGIWGDLPGLAALARRTLEDVPSLAGLDTVLHLDIHPSNVGLQIATPCRSALIDWDMTGWGAPELDLAYLDLQPYGASHAVGRDEVLDLYWKERMRLEGPAPSGVERRRRQRVADRIFALSLVAVAHRSATDPYPPGSSPGKYWSAMRPKLFEKLTALLAP